MSTHEAALNAPYFVEIHGPYGHGILPGGYAARQDAIKVADMLQKQDQDGTYYAVSDKDQSIVYCCAIPTIASST